MTIAFKMHAPSFDRDPRYTEHVVFSDNYVEGKEAITMMVAPQDHLSDQRLRDIVENTDRTNDFLVTLRGAIAAEFPEMFLAMFCATAVTIVAFFSPVTAFP